MGVSLISSFTRLAAPPCLLKGLLWGKQKFRRQFSAFASQIFALHASDWNLFSASPKPHPSKPHPCNMPQAKTEVALQFLECCAAETALQHSLFCRADVICTKSCAAANENCTATSKSLRCRKVAPSCRFLAGFKPPRLGTHVSDLLMFSPGNRLVQFKPLSSFPYVRHERSLSKPSSCW